MLHPTPPQVLLATPLQPLVVQLSGSVARGAPLMDQCVPHAPTPQLMATFERDLSPLIRAVGRRLVAWGLHPLESDAPDEVPSRLWCKGQASRRRRKHRPSLATLCGPVVVWRRLSEPLRPGRRAIHPVELTLGRQAGWATPVLAERVGRWAAAQTQRQGLEMGQQDPGGYGSCVTLRKLLRSLRAGMAPQRQAAQSAPVVRWLPQARAAPGRLQALLAVGRDGVHGPRRHQAWKEGATATVSVLECRGTRVGTGSLGQMPEAGQPPLTTPLTALCQDIVQHVDAQSRRVVSGSDDGSHPRDSDHPVLKTMPAPRRPWCQRPWRRMVDSSQAWLYIQQLAEARLGSTPPGRAWAQQMRQPLKTTSAGITRVLPSAGALRRQHGLWGKVKA
jgi:hypothetical protein